MSTWTDQPLRTAALVFFDLETTALRPDRGGRICEMAVVDEQGIRFDWRSDAARPRDRGALGVDFGATPTRPRN